MLNHQATRETSCPPIAIEGMLPLSRIISVVIASKSEAIQTWGLRLRLRLDRFAVARDDNRNCANLKTTCSNILVGYT
jgi:hypothetical protein